MNIKGTRSEANIRAAFSGESKSRNKYTYYAAKAREEGNSVVAILFEQMAENEKEHAKLWFSLLQEDENDTKANLRSAAASENTEWKHMYPSFAATAREEGLESLALLFEKIAAIESDHEKKFLEMLVEQIQLDQLNSISEKHTNPDTSPVGSETAAAISAAIPSGETKKYRCFFCGDMEDEGLNVCPICKSIAPFELVEKLD